MKKGHLCKKNTVHGQMTIYLVLMLAVLIPLIFTMIEGVRASAMKVQLACVTDMGCDSILAEYHRGLMDRYDLLFVDTSYENATGSLTYTKEHLLDYMDYNLNPGKDLVIRESRDFFGFETPTVDIIKASRATDEQGAVFRYMVVSYMKEKYGLSYVADMSDVVNQAESYGIFDYDIVAENEQSQREIAEIEIPEPEEGEEWEEITIENPTEGVNQVRSQGILNLVCQETVSGKTITPSLYVSGRSLVNGDGMWENWQSPNAFEEQLLFNEYIMEKCGNYRNPQDGSLLDYEVEYIIAGNNNDTDNLISVVNRLLLIRGGANSAYFFTNEELMMQAKTAASTLACVVTLPELEIIFEAAIIAAWIYAESVYDVRQLLEGERVPLIKTPGQWNLSLESALGISEEILESEVTDQEGTGLNYEEYIRILLYTTPLESRTLRMMDTVEMNIRQMDGQENFRMDDCVAAFRTQMIFTSTFGYSFLVERDFGYY